MCFGDVHKLLSETHVATNSRKSPYSLGDSRNMPPIIPHIFVRRVKCLHLSVDNFIVAI